MPAFSAERAEAIIERELGAPVGVLFRSFDRQPIAAASLGQASGDGEGWGCLPGLREIPGRSMPCTRHVVCTAL